MFDNSKIKKSPLHGGNLTAAAAEFGVPLADWLDLSTGINPVCYPDTAISENSFRMLPTPGDVAELNSSARQYYSVTDNSSIVAAPGTQSVLQVLPQFHPNRTIAILSPTYSEHGHTWDTSGNKTVDVAEFDQLNQGDIAVLVNPNNPDGRHYQPADILKLAQKVELVIVDEAFCDVSPELSIVPLLRSQNILVLRSLGKFFGLAGLRLGFVIGPAGITSAVIDRLGPWAVAGPAIEIGKRALADNTWHSTMRTQLADQSKRLNDLLNVHHLSIIGSTDLFTLIETPKAQAIYDTFGRAGILIRRFEDQANWLRIGLPGSETEWQKIEVTLGAIDNMGE